MIAPSLTPARDLTCAACGSAFTCTGDLACWCVAEPCRLRMTDIDTQRDCLCPACLRRAAAAQNTATLSTRSGSS